MDRPTMRAAALLGFEESYQRWWTQWSLGADPLQCFPPLAEVLWWSCALDESFWSDEYTSMRNDDEDGRLMPAVRWARNQTNHALALVQTDDPPSDTPYDAYYLVDLRWARADVIPRGNRDDPNGRAAYESHLEGRPVIETLDQIRSWLQRARQAQPDR